MPAQDPKRLKLGIAKLAQEAGAAGRAVRSAQHTGTPVTPREFLRGNGVKTIFTLSHYRGSQKVQVDVLAPLDEYRTVDQSTYTVYRPSTQTIRIEFDSAPATDSVLILVR